MTKEKNETQRMANTGVTIELKKLGKSVVVRELTMESIIRCAQEVATLLATMDLGTDGNTAALITQVLGNPQSVDALKVFAAESTDTAPTDWTAAGVGDWVKFVKAAKIVNDWAELKELFMEAGLTKLLQAKPA